MNKTVNINLAGMFFHIDEDAYQKLQRYLDAIKRSFTDSQGRAEILADIEARIAELFSERIQSDRQVVSVKQVDEVIAIMGQPEDYLVDDEIFEDEPKTHKTQRTATSKKLFRDKDNSYIAGVSSGLGHYLGIEAVWVRLLWILLTLGSGGTFIFIYILFWILVPEAVTTSEKLTMTGEAVNISNIEKKIKDGIGSVSETVKNVDYQKYGDKIKHNSKSFFDTIGDIIMFVLKLFAKFFGLILIISSAAALVAVLISSISLSSTSFFKPWWMDYPDALNMSGVPIWVGSILLFLFFGIPLFFLIYLGLKILINNLKSIGNVAKFTLIGLWIISLIGLISIGVKYASEFSQEAVVTEKFDLNVNTSDTLSIKMIASNLDRNKHFWRNDGFEIKYNENDEKIMFLKNMGLYIYSTKDSIASVQVEKEARGNDYLSAKENAQKIVYNFELKDNVLNLDNFLITDPENKYHNQLVNVKVYLPENTVVKLDDNTKSYLEYNRNNLLNHKDAGHLLIILENNAECLDCNDAVEVDIDIQNDGNGIKITNNALEIKNDSLKININGESVKANSESVKVNISEESGIEIKSNN